MDTKYLCINLRNIYVIYAETQVRIITREAKPIVLKDICVVTTA